MHTVHLEHAYTLQEEPRISVVVDGLTIKAFHDLHSYDVYGLDCEQHDIINNSSVDARIQ